jgi:hypothetical protein
MNSPSLLAILETGPRTASELLHTLGASKSTLSRRVIAAGDAVVSFGAARNSSYALRRRVGNYDRFPIHRINPRAKVEPLGEIIPVAPTGYVVRVTGGADEYLPGLPWWLQDMRPQGFLGRAFVQTHAAILGLPEEIELWTDDHCLIALAERGEDFVGNVVVGNESLRRFLTQPRINPLSPAERREAYPRMALAALAGEIIGSSAGGEQPKFSAFVDHADGPCAVLVKFSAPGSGNNTVATRWGSLLVAEHLAHEALRQAGVAAAQSELLWFDDQAFLEMRRFDRAGLKGRRGVVSLGALENQFIGRASAAWPAISAELERLNHITAEANRDVQRLHVFGRLIGNTDMHSWNVAFLHDGETPLALAPAFDMLPMQWAPPRSGFVSNVEFKVAFDTPPPIEIWREMLPVAIAFWSTLRDADRIDADFRAAAGAALTVVNDLAGHLLPD